ncbi:MAG: AMP-binding protein [Planctomycetes bacterium]|nr:AMP-binding protein [Planctomycetota bacterium]
MYPRGATPIWIEATLERLRARGDAVVLHDGADPRNDGGPEATARELLVESGALAVAWFRLGLRPGDRLLLALPSGRRFVTQLLAAARAGLIVVPLHPKVKPRELAHVVWDSGPRAALADEPLADLLRVAHPQVRVVELARLAAEVEAARRELGETEAEAGVELALDHAGVTAGADDPLLLLYTSGTTGKPKGALHTHGSLGANLAALAEAWQLSTSDRLLHCLPLHHLHGLAVGVMGSLLAGVTLDLCAGFEQREVAARLSSGGATLFYGVPSMVARLLELELPPLPAMRLFVSGSAPLPAAQKRRFAAKFGHAIVERYGATEMGIALAQRADDAVRPAGSVGVPLAGVETRLVPTEAGGGADEGELWVRGPSLFAGYWEDEEATAKARGDGWYRTGDLARRHDDGSFTIVGRLSTDVIKVHGHKVGALEIESCLADHPAVAEAAVVGRADPTSGQQVVAYVRLREGAGEPRAAERDASLIEALLTHCRTQLAPYQVPARLEIVADLPRTGPGKVDKRALP